jgi:glutamyl-tRNA synthetase
MPLCHTRIKTFGDFIELCGFFFVNNLPYTVDLLAPKGMPPEQSCMLLQSLIWWLDENENWESSGFNQGSRDVAAAFGVHHKKVLMPILFGSLMGKHHGPPLFDSAELLGKDRARVRLLRSIEFLGGLSNKKLSQLQKCWANGCQCQELFITPAAKG